MALTFANAIGGSGAVIQAGGGVVTLSNANNTFTGNVLVTSGTLLSTGNYNNSELISGHKQYGYGCAGAMLNVGGSVGGVMYKNTVAVNSGGALYFSETAGQNGPYMGTLNLNGASVGSAGANSGPRFRNDYAASVINSSGAASTWSCPLWLVNEGGTTLTISTSANLAISGAIQDFGGLAGSSVVKTGTGMLTLSATNTFTGNVMVASGTLLSTANGGYGGSFPYYSSLGLNNTITVGSGAMLNVGGSVGGATVSNTVAVNNGGAVYFSETAGNSGPYMGTFNLNGGICCRGGGQQRTSFWKSGQRRHQFQRRRLHVVGSDLVGECQRLHLDHQHQRESRHVRRHPGLSWLLGHAAD